MFPGRIKTNDQTASPAVPEAIWSKVLPSVGTVCAMTLRPSMLTQTPLKRRAATPQ